MTSATLPRYHVRKQHSAPEGHPGNLGVAPRSVGASAQVGRPRLETQQSQLSTARDRVSNAARRMKLSTLRFLIGEDADAEVWDKRRMALSTKRFGGALKEEEIGRSLKRQASQTSEGVHRLRPAARRPALVQLYGTTRSAVRRRMTGESSTLTRPRPPRTPMIERAKPGAISAPPEVIEFPKWPMPEPAEVVTRLDSLSGRVPVCDSVQDDTFFDLPEEPGSLYGSVFDLAPPTPLPPFSSGQLYNLDVPPSFPSMTASGDSTFDEVDGLPEFREKMTDLIQQAVGRSNRRVAGRGFVGRLFDRQIRWGRMTDEVRSQLREFAHDEHIPFFTYWISLVQVLIFIVAVSVYGLAPIGIGQRETKAEVFMPNLAYEHSVQLEPENFWIGPRQNDLIHLGAKYSPCMRRDRMIWREILKERRAELNTGCCIRNDDNVCVQRKLSKCSTLTSSWGNHTVCGLDPRYCKNPADVHPFHWSDTITEWPICKERATPPGAAASERHMTCEVLARPCCVGIRGECVVTTRDQCLFWKGRFHQNASLCSQVSCLDRVCGMLPFVHADSPDQFYRLWCSLFLHAGIFHLLISLLFQYFVMRDMEKFAGWLRIAIIYIFSGIAGNLSSAIFLPYHVEAGPAGAQFGIIACLFVEIFQSWQLLARPWTAVGKLALVLVVLVLLGLLPWINNYNHFSGFLMGILLSFTLLPYISFGSSDRRRKLIGTFVCLATAVGLLTLLFILFYLVPITECSWCSYLTCIPFTADFCKNQAIQVNREYISAMS